MHPMAATAELAGLKLEGRLDFSGLPEGEWSLVPLAAADGVIRAEIVDAHLMFDAQVTVPIRQGQIDFDDATVEHVGPDSRMGVSKLGLYVDAANGRSYLYQFQATPIAGVEFERRGLGPWVSDRGKLRLQEFAESVLRPAPRATGFGFTGQARLLFDRTAVSGEVQLGDGKFAAPGAQAELAGRSEGRNAVRMHSDAVGRGLTVDLSSLLVRNVVLKSGNTELGCDEITGAIKLRLFVEGAQVRFALELANMKISGLRLALPGGTP